MKRRASRASAWSLATVVLFLAAGGAMADVIDVNDTRDLPDADPNDGVCDADLDTAGNQCTLRAAIMHAHTTAGDDTINVPAGRYRLTLRGGGTGDGSAGDLDFRTADQIRIVGAGAAMTVVDGKKAKNRLFHVHPGASLSLTGLTLTKGNRKGDSETGRGAAVFVQGTLEMSKCVVVKNKSENDGGGVSLVDGSAVIRDTEFAKNKSKDDGGAIDATGVGTLTLDRVTFWKNKSKAEGGAVENSATLTATNVTFSANKARTIGGALNVQNDAVASLTNGTLTKNKAKEGSAIAVDDSTAVINVRNTIFLKNKKDDCSGNVTSDGGNMEDGATCATELTDFPNFDALLDKLADNGGCVRTHALKPGSPAVDTGDDANCPAQDARGEQRGANQCDIGAFESNPAP